MTGVRLLKKDVLLGIAKKWFMYLVVVIVGYFAAKDLLVNIQVGIEDGYLYKSGTFLDVFLYSTKGMQVFNLGPTTIFELPIYWFTFQIGIHYIVAYYPHKDYKEYGRLIFLSAKSRSKWWFSKCVWCLLAVLLYYVVMIGTVAVTTVLNHGSLSLELTEEIMDFFVGSSMRYVSANDMLYIAVLVPVVITVSLCILQMLLSFWLSPVVSFAAMCGVYVLSAYYTVWWLPANYTMWLRSSYVSEGGVSPDSGLILGLFILLFSVLSGWIYFGRKDVI